MGQTALTLAARQMDAALTVSALLESGADADYVENDGDTAAFIAFKNGAYLNLEVLLKHGIDLTAHTKRWKNTKRDVPHLTYLVLQKMKNTGKNLDKWVEL